ncbi:MAG: hypothetical protein KKE65_10350 [Actinobacteria bacterium]|nr:hypothetical protein [Actinomycetota bacterium]
MWGAALAFIGLGLTLIGGYQKGVAAGLAVNELIATLDSAIIGLQNQIEGIEGFVDESGQGTRLGTIEGSRARESRQADEVLEETRTDILAKEQEFIEKDDNYESKLEMDIKARFDRHEIDQAEYDRQIANIPINRQLALDEIELQKAQAGEKKALTIQQLRDRAAAGDIEAERKIAQINGNRDLFLSQTKDQAILTLNRQGEQGEFQVGRAVQEERTAVGKEVARLAATAVRRTGSPLLALRQIERAAREGTVEAKREALFGIRSATQSVKDKVVQARDQAGDNVEDVMAANVMEDMQLEQQIEQTELTFTQTYENLEFSILQTNTRFDQDLAALEAQKHAEDVNYQADVGQLRKDAAMAYDQLERDLNSAVLTNTQAKQDINQQADLLTQEYRRNLAEAQRHRTNLQENRHQIGLAAAFGAVPGLLSAASSFVGAMGIV